MIQEIDIKLLPEQIEDANVIEQKIRFQIAFDKERPMTWQLLKRSLDARQRIPIYQVKIRVFIGEVPVAEPLLSEAFQQVDQAKECIIIGAGPAGYFAALRLIEKGIKPVIFERGKDVQARRKDLRAIQQEGIVNPDSNYCFGEGGAGTYSDGKLYTRSTKRGDVNRVLKMLVEHGAPSDILADAHPHIGTNKLPVLVSNMRASIEQYGGQVHFNSSVVDLIVKDRKVIGVILANGEEKLADAVILATGHSARDIFYMLQRRGIKMEAKPFALGVRVEHPQPLIDAIQYKQSPRDPNLPASSYSLACQIEDKGVFSFCMCPGGLIVPSATAPGEIVVNGMSPSRRDSPYANSGVVVSVNLEDLAPFADAGVFAAMEYQKSVEQEMFRAGDGSQKAPALRLTDFVNAKLTSKLPDSSYIPGLFTAPLNTLLPSEIYTRLKRGILEFDKKMKGFLTEEAVVVGTESRTSSPIKIPRDAESLMHPEAMQLFPCGEGAGYAGGIVSAAIDGDNVALAVSRYFEQK